MELRAPDLVTLYSDGAVMCSRGEGIREDRGSVRYEMENDGLRVFVKSALGVRYLRMDWACTRGSDVKVLGDAWERSYGNLAWNTVCPERCMPWYMAISNGSDQDPDTTHRFTECFGVGVQPNSLAFWQYTGDFLTLWLDIRNGGMPTLLGERELCAATVYFREYLGVRAFSAVRDFARVMSWQPRLASHKVFGSNNWYYAYGKSSQEEILNDTRLIVSLCERAQGKPYMVIDDGWQPNSCDAPWDRGNKSFPDMAGLARKMKALGARPGIWVRCLVNAKKSELTKDINDRAQLYLSKNPNVLDPSHPEVIEYVSNTVKRFVDWGYELIKHDYTAYDILGGYCNGRRDTATDDGWCFYDRTRTTAEIIKGLYSAIQESAGDAIVIGCNTISHLCAGIHQLNRTGDDTSGRDFQRTLTMGVNTLAFRLPQHNSFYGVDADCVGITEKIPWEKNRQWLELLARSSTPLFVSVKPDLLSEEQTEELKDAFAVASLQEDEMIPVDWMETTTPSRYLVNGKEVRFKWYTEKGNESFAP